MVIEQSINGFLSKYPNISEENVEKLKKEHTPESLINIMADVFCRHLSEGEMQELIKFYSSCVGKKRHGTSLMLDLQKTVKDWALMVDDEFAACDISSSDQ